MTNRLAHETSPYLIQHKNNPVDWYPWGDEALARARDENKPILLSVGYAACHWCHVMAHESFEDEATAALMNELYINIKVDREERPDLDSIYQTALALTGQQGGWPLTVFLRPDGRPFFGGTYFPNERRYGRPAFRDVLTEIARIYREEPERVDKAQAAIMERLQPVLNPSAPGELSIAALDQIAAQIVRLIDPQSGGVGEAPKFPNTPLLELLWRAYLRTGEENYRSAVELSLTHMCQGGIYDHLGGGFARYSVDAEWLTPHFEKMLYDNAQLVSLLTLAWQSTKSPLFKARVEETVDWALREMCHPEGGFYSSLDADSEGEEGKFYVWTRDEIESVLGTDDAALICSVYGVKEEGNFEGKTILNRLGSLELGDEAHEMRLKSAREKLLAARAHRVRPGLDDKILADWNGLMIEALARAATVFDRPGWLDVARGAFVFITENLGNNNRLLHAWREGPGPHPGLAEDFANMIAAALALYEATGEQAYLGRAEALSVTLQTEFTAPGGGYYQAPASAVDVIVRSRTVWDNAVPPANATMLTSHARLAALTGAEGHAAAADGIVQVFAGAALRQPSGAASFLNAAELLMAPVTIGLAGESPDGALARTAAAAGDPNRIIAFIPEDTDLPPDHPLAGKMAIGGKPTAYVCRGQVCSAPVTTAEDLTALLAAK